MCVIKTFLGCVSLILLVTACFCIYRVFPEKKVGNHSKIGGQGPCENEYNKYCWNGGECYYLIDGNIVNCNCTLFHGGKLCEKSMSWI